MNWNNPLGGIPRLQFSEERRRQFETMSDDILEHTLDVHNDFHASKKQSKTSKHWKLMRRKKSLNIYRERGKSDSKKERTLLCSGVVPGTVEDMISGTYADDTDSMRISLSILTDTFMDGSVLHVFEKNPMASSVVFSGIKWMALKMPSTASLIHDRDVLAYYRIGRIVDNRRGQYFVYYVAQSIDLPELPANQQRHLERAEISLCYLFRQVQEDWVGCFVMGSTKMGGSMPRSMGEFIAAENMLTVSKLLRVAHAKAYLALMMKNAERLPSTSDCCDVCMKAPKILEGTKKLCMGCRRKTCRKCRECCVVFRLAPRTQRPAKENFCSQCISEVTKTTTSSFYMSSLNKSTNQSFASSSTDPKPSSSGMGSSSPASPQSQDFSEIDPDAWLSHQPDLPENLDGLASFVERASIVNATEPQWNQQELEYLSDILRESGHYRAPQTTSRPVLSNNSHLNNNSNNNRGNHTRRTQSYTQGFNPSSSLPPPDTDERVDRRLSRSYDRQKYFNVDELD